MHTQKNALEKVQTHVHHFGLPNDLTHVHGTSYLFIMFEQKYKNFKIAGLLVTPFARVRCSEPTQRGLSPSATSRRPGIGGVGRETRGFCETTALPRPGHSGRDPPVHSEATPPKGLASLRTDGPREGEIRGVPPHLGV